MAFDYEKYCVNESNRINKIEKYNEKNRDVHKRIKFETKRKTYPFETIKTREIGPKKYIFTIYNDDQNVRRIYYTRYSVSFVNWWFLYYTNGSVHFQ